MLPMLLQVEICLEVLLRFELVRSSLLDGRFESFKRLPLRQLLSQLLAAAVLEPPRSIAEHLVEDLIELHPFVVQVLHRLDQELLDLPDLALLGAGVERLELLLQAEGEGEQIAVVGAQLADNLVVSQDAARLVALNQGGQFLVRF